MSNALFLSCLPDRLHAHANGSTDAIDELIRPLPHSELHIRRSARSSFASWHITPGTPSPGLGASSDHPPPSPLENCALYPPPPHLTPLSSPLPTPPRTLSPTRHSHRPSRRSRPVSPVKNGSGAAAAAAAAEWTEDDEDDGLFETEVFGRLLVTVVEAKGLAVPDDNVAKPYVLLQYDRTLSVSREWGAPPASSDAPAKKNGIRRSNKSSTNGTTTSRRVGGGPSPTSSTPSSASHSRSSSTDAIPSLHSVPLPTSPPKYRPEATLRPVSPSAPTLPESLIGTQSNPIWNHQATFDVVAPSGRTVLVCVYDKLAPQGGPPTRSHGFCGACIFEPPLLEEGRDYEGEDGKGLDVWIPLTSALDPTIGGEIRLRIQFEPLLSRPKLSISDFQLLRLIGQGSFGQVFRVRKRDTKRIYALKVIRKSTVGDDPRALKQVWTERKVLEGNNQSPFLCGLKFGFQNEGCFFFCLDYKAGGELFSHLQRDGGRFDEGKVRFYIAEIVLALGFLHERGIVYRDLKPENCLLDGAGHVVLCDFGLSKILENEPEQKTWTMCGTTSFLAPEVLLDVGYSYPSDFWSLGVLLFEMLYGYSPFFSENRMDEYERILTLEVKIPNKKGCGEEVKDLLLKLLERDPALRLGATNGASDIQSHPFFTPIDWPRLALKQVSPPFKPPTHADDDQPDWNDDGRSWRFDIDVGACQASTTTTQPNSARSSFGGGGGGRKSQAGATTCSLVRGFTYIQKENPAGKWWERRAAALWGPDGAKKQGGGGGAEGAEEEGEEDEEGGARLGRTKTEGDCGAEGRRGGVERFREGEMQAGARRSSCV